MLFCFEAQADDLPAGENRLEQSAPMGTPAPPPHATDQEKIRAESRRFIDALATRLGELEELAGKAKHYEVFSPVEYAEFRRVFGNFREVSEEFRMLSHLTENSLGKFQLGGSIASEEYAKLDEYFWRLQVPMLRGVIKTNLHLLKVWDDRLQRGQELPYGAYELFLETLHIICGARVELQRPRFAALLDEAALRDADRVERLLDTLMLQAPKLREFLSEGDLVAESKEATQPDNFPTDDTS